MTGGAPPEQAEASPDQIAALRSKMEAGGAPYADFAVFVAHGARFAKLRKFDAQVFVNNVLQQRVLRGPSNFQSWMDSWRVFRTAMLSLKEASPQTLDDYAHGIQTLVNIHPSADDWGLIYAADEVMRHEVWGKIKDEMVLDGEWPEVCPWNEVIKRSVYGSGDTKRMHWWFLHVLAPSQHGGKALVRSVEGTSLIPSPDGLFGNTAVQSRSVGASSGEVNVGEKGGRKRLTRTERRQKALSSMWQDSSFASGSGGYQADKGKGKNFSKGNGKGKSKGVRTTARMAGRTSAAKVARALRSEGERGRWQKGA